MHQQPPKSWWSRNFKWLLPVCIGAPILVCGGFVSLLLSLVFGLIKNSEPYEQALYTARTDRAVISAMGAPIEAGIFVAGNIEVSPSSGYADLAIPISGPRGSGTIYAEAEKYEGQWYFSTLEVAVEETDQWIDLLGGP
jgi:hypothetical protein